MGADQEMSKLALLVSCVVISVAVVGYFTGLQAPMREVEALPELFESEHSHEASPNDSDGASVSQTLSPTSHDGVIPATHYAKMPEATMARAASWRTQFSKLQSRANLLDEVTIEPGDKQIALRQREQNRAFNGAPPTIPHPVDQRSTHTCIACHQDGARTDSLRIPAMSHQYLTNCTQCHVESIPRPMSETLFQENTFAGMPAPTNGPRAYAGAPPQIPHSTWMRSNCMSCHGLAGFQGIRTTHPWRKNCTQCHAPSATMDQTLLAAEPKFLPPPLVEN